MGKVEGDVVKDKENEYFKMVRVQWWVPMKKGSILDEQHLYEDSGMASGNVINRSRTMAWHFSYCFLFSHWGQYNKQ
jgi:hypothetical protein